MGSCGMGELTMTEAIFLSAGVPDPKRGPQYAATADTVAITAAVSALVHVTLGRRLLVRSEEHTYELLSLMRISYAVFCLKKKKKYYKQHTTQNTDSSSIQ